MPTWLIIVIVVLVLLAVGGVIARTRSSRAPGPRSTARSPRPTATSPPRRPPTAAGTAQRLEAAARAAYADQHGGEPESLTLVEVLDRPGTDEDEAVFDADGQRVVLGRRGDEWSERA